MGIGLGRQKELYEDLDVCFSNLPEHIKPSFVKSIRTLTSSVVDDGMFGTVYRWMRDHDIPK